MRNSLERFCHPSYALGTHLRDIYKGDRELAAYDLFMMGMSPAFQFAVHERTEATVGSTLNSAHFRADNRNLEKMLERGGRIGPYAVMLFSREPYVAAGIGIWLHKNNPFVAQTSIE